MSRHVRISHLVVSSCRGIVILIRHKLNYASKTHWQRDTFSAAISE